MANANQVIVNGETILDLRSDTVTPETLQKGYTAHDKSGTKITGTLEVPATEEQTVELSMLSGNQVIQPTNGKVMSKVTVQKPDTLLPENIKKGVVIGGVVGTLESGGTRETWVIKSDASGEFATTQIAFTSNGRKFTSIGANGVGTFIVLHYDNNEVAGYDPGVGGVYEFDNEAYRKLTFDTPPTGDLLTWLQSNAVKQPDGTAVQDTKALTITSNGTVSVTPDAPYDGLSSVDVTVNVSGGGGSGGISDFACLAWGKSISDSAIAEINESHDYLIIHNGNGSKVAIISNNSFVFLSPNFSGIRNDHLEISGSELYYLEGAFGMGAKISVFEISY